MKITDNVMVICSTERQEVYISCYPESAVTIPKDKILLLITSLLDCNELMSKDEEEIQMT